MRVKSNFPYPDARKFVTRLAGGGRHSFTSTQAQNALGGTAAATKLALNRLAKQGVIASPARGFYVIVPPEYQSLGCPPADHFIPDLMAHYGQPYYVGLLSAAQYHGAAHHRPQVFQVMLAKNRRPIECGAVRVSFIARARITGVPTMTFNTPRGVLRVATPEATALDLVGYPDHAGGLDQTATILADLVEKIDANRLAQAAESAPITWAQRLGYLLDFIEAHEAAAPLAAYVAGHAHEATPLLPSAPVIDSARNRTWKLFENATVEPDA
jgi:predicted transcriptional regulator of viral defense system